MAATETVEDRVCHSLHCYFIRPGATRRSRSSMRSTALLSTTTSRTARRVTAGPACARRSSASPPRSRSPRGLRAPGEWMPDGPAAGSARGRISPNARPCWRKLPEQARRGDGEPTARRAAGRVRSACAGARRRRRSPTSGCAPRRGRGPTSTCIRPMGGLRVRMPLGSGDLLVTAAVTWQTGGLQSASLVCAVRVPTGRRTSTRANSTPRKEFERVWRRLHPRPGVQPRRRAGGSPRWPRKALIRQRKPG